MPAHHINTNIFHSCQCPGWSHLYWGFKCSLVSISSITMFGFAQPMVVQYLRTSSLVFTTKPLNPASQLSWIFLLSFRINSRGYFPAWWYHLHASCSEHCIDRFCRVVNVETVLNRCLIASDGVQPICTSPESDSNQRIVYKRELTRNFTKTPTPETYKESSAVL